MSTRRTMLKRLGVAAATTAGAAAIAPTQALAAGPTDDILLDSFTGTDDAKLTQAMAAARLSSPRRAIRLAGRNHTFTQTRTTSPGYGSSARTSAGRTPRSPGRPGRFRSAPSR